jgi:type II secretory pathway predicted ATPase ExeA
MYTSYWGLQRQPFDNVPSQEFFYRSSQHEEALLRLVYAVEHSKGLAVLTGEVGAGKTTISRVLYDYLNMDGYEVVTLVNPSLEPVDFLRAVLMKLGVDDAQSPSKSVVLDQLNERLIQNASQDIKTILVIDEAHLVRDKPILEELRMLLNLQHNNQFLLTLIMMGQPPLAGNLKLMKPLKERIAIQFDLKPLDERDTMRYILYRLKHAGASRGIFTKDAIPPIYAFSKGIPLRINNVCERSLLMGMMRKAVNINEKIVNIAVADISR